MMAIWTSSRRAVWTTTLRCFSTMVMPCPWDCSPAGVNGLVNIDDLFAVINNFGDCP